MPIIILDAGDVNVTEQQFVVDVDEIMSTITILPDIYLRSNESKALQHKLKINGITTSLVGWTIELYVSGTIYKTITEASDDTTAGIIKNQTTNTGEYEFVILAADWALIAACRPLTLPCYVRYITPDVTPPKVFSNVEFNIILAKA